MKRCYAARSRWLPARDAAWDARTRLSWRSTAPMSWCTTSCRIASRVAGIVRQHGNRVLEAVTDVADPAAMEQLVKRIEKDLGPISILVNNAGIGADRAVTEAIDEAMFDRMFDIHVKGTFFTTRAVLPGMKSLGSGAIVNISSIWGMVGHHFGSTYCAAKAAILGFTKSWAKELAPHHITVNAIAPGGVTSPMAIRRTGSTRCANA